MLTALLALTVAVAVVALGWWGFPYVVLRLTLRSLGMRWMRRNYRGRAVRLGLVFGWMAAALASIVSALLALPRVHGSAYLAGAFTAPLVVLAVGLLGTLDDLRGDREHRGFRGHLGALRHGKVTTGLVKLVGIVAVGLMAGAADAWSRQITAAPTYLGRTVLVGASIALTANLVNLLDLRPGRALKTYFALISAVAVVRLATSLADARAASAPAWVLATAVVTGWLVAAGPALACWPFDLGEVAMLGDGGANAAGALAGWMLAATLPGPALIAWAVIALALNLASERVSFSAVIEKVGVLRWADGLGRLRSSVTAPESGQDSRKV